MAIVTPAKPELAVVSLPENVNPTTEAQVSLQAIAGRQLRDAEPTFYQKSMAFLDALPAEADKALPTWAKILSSSVLVPMSISYGITRSAVKAIWTLPSAAGHVLAGDVSVSDVGRGLWLTTKEGAQKLWNVPGLVMEGRFITAGSGVGDVTFDVGSMVLGGTAVFKLGKVVTAAGTRIAQATTVVAEGITESGQKLAQAMVDALGPPLQPAFAGAAGRLPPNTLAMASTKPGPTWLTAPFPGKSTPSRGTPAVTPPKRTASGTYQVAAPSTPAEFIATQLGIPSQFISKIGETLRALGIDNGQNAVSGFEFLYKPQGLPREFVLGSRREILVHGIRYVFQVAKNGKRVYITH